MWLVVNHEDDVYHAISCDLQNSFVSFALDANCNPGSKWPPPTCERLWYGTPRTKEEEGDPYLFSFLLFPAFQKFIEDVLFHD